MKLRILVALASDKNDYQNAQARSAQEAGRSKNVDVQVLFCDGGGVEQSQQILKYVLSRSEASTIAGIIVQPVGTGLVQVAQAAASAGIGWVVLHREVEYVSELRTKYGVPVFVLRSNHNEEGRIQGRQLAVLLPKGGRIIYIAGPNTDSVSQERSIGISETRPENIQSLMLRGNWTTEGAYKAISSWWNLPTSRQQSIVAVVAQNDAMAFGAKKVLQEIGKDYANLPIIGCDGLPESGQAWVNKGLLKATVVVPILAGVAVSMLVTAIVEKKNPAEHTVVAPESYPNLGEIAKYHEHATSSSIQA